ncbi:hypothetical protein C1T17_06510 [Sphingobium sp. SCG-1]|uniref:hypothetical protein n=1 Tax=Sphingobium sp. SCG-1 TaxID=2072936 RepID=UPI000CD69412|nr:hypothetical protein [Sphingobium sp. SCG-1]AUW57811.1 hypothetical protein C1T17_06510 [Sphingobium sp. SCG-1]
MARTGIEHGRHGIVPGFDFEIDRHNRMVTAVARGFWTLDTVAAFEQRWREAMVEIRASVDPDETVYYLADCSDQPPQVRTSCAPCRL